ncbi:MAG: hypothetical protein LBN08_07510 [Lactobacillales bacterium]|jgi:adenylate kinase family enzyme|nr:hypothetical protein [Lactobacillales bacterium]
MKKIIIIGNAGTGKSTLSRRLGEKLGLPLYHLDAIWHLPGGAVMAGGSWIVDGNFGMSMDLRISLCDMIVFLDFSPLYCAWSVFMRSLKYLKDRSEQPEMPDYFEEHMFGKEYREFMAMILTYNKKKRPAAVASMARRPDGVELVVLKSRKEVHKWFDSL